MTPLRIQCETCQTRLRVRDPGFVGQVHACPKCGGMVLIAAPEDANPTPVAIHEAETAAPLILVMSDTLVPEESTPSVVPTQELAPSPIEPPEEPAPLPTRQAAPLAGVAVAITTIALTATAALVAYGWLSPSTPQVVANERVSKATEVPSPALLTQKPAQESFQQEVLKPTIEPESSPRTKPLPEVPLAIVANAPSETEPVRVAVAEPPPVAFDPLDYDPSTIDLVLHPGRAPEIEASAGSRTHHSEADRLLPRQGIDAKRNPISIERISSEAPATLFTTNAEELLALPIPQIDLAEVPLAEAVDLLAELSGAPITLPPTSLRLAGIDAQRKVKIQGVGIPLGEVLRTTLAQARLTWQVEGAHVLVARPKVDTVRTVTHRLADLALERPNELATLFTQVGPREIATSDLQIVDGNLTLEAPGRVQYALLILAERLRVAQGLPPQSKYPRRLLRVDPTLERLSPLLERRTTFSFVSPTPLKRLFEHWSQGTGLTLLIDWGSLADAGLGPRTLVQTSCADQPWHAALDGVLGQLGLAWSAADGQTLWISTTDLIATEDQTEFYPFLSTTEAKQLAQQVPQATVAHDALTRTAIVRGPQQLQRAACAWWQDRP